MRIERNVRYLYYIVPVYIIFQTLDKTSYNRFTYEI